jgi:hypothetical protein
MSYSLAGLFEKLLHTSIAQWGQLSSYFNIFRKIPALQFNQNTNDHHKGPQNKTPQKTHNGAQKTITDHKGQQRVEVLKNYTSLEAQKHKNAQMTMKVHQET